MMAGELKRFVLRLIRERNAIQQCLASDRQNKKLQKAIDDWNSGLIDDDDGWFPAGETTALLDSLVPRAGDSEADKLYHAAVSIAMDLSPQVLLPKLEAAMGAHKLLYRQARKAYQQQSTQLAGLPQHGAAVNSIQPFCNSASSAKPNKNIDPAYRSRPMSLREAGMLLRDKNRKIERKKAGEWIKQCIKDGSIHCEKLTRQKYVFDIRDFSEAVRKQMTPVGQVTPN